MMSARARVCMATLARRGRNATKHAIGDLTNEAQQIVLPQLERVVSVQDKLLPRSILQLDSVHRLNETCNSLSNDIRGLKNISENHIQAAKTTFLQGERLLGDHLEQMMGAMANTEGISNTTKKNQGLLDAADKSLKIIWPAITVARMVLQQYGKVLSDEEPAVVETVVVDQVQDAVTDASALFLEKHGISASIEVLTAEAEDEEEIHNCTAITARGHINFMLIELLKNSLGASYKHYGIDMDMADPIQVRVSCNEEEIGIRVSDRAGGIDPIVALNANGFFRTTVIPRGPSYTFSGDFGGELEGRGAGLAITECITKMYRGTTTISSLPGFGTDVTLVFKKAALI
eukprot:m.164778 g.164778  ORF g.164778 m.164778 type:complete len:346 (+) comp15246_c0_seq2:249-1286(+)